MAKSIPHHSIAGFKSIGAIRREAPSISSTSQRLITA